MKKAPAGAFFSFRDESEICIFRLTFNNLTNWLINSCGEVPEARTPGFYWAVKTQLGGRTDWKLSI
jgi:hypothetical protein